MYEVKLIIADAEQISAHADKIISGISQYYAAGYRNIKRKQEAGQELTAGFLLKKYLGVHSDAQLIRNDYGKPMLRSAQAYFNLSHSGKYVVLAISAIEIGVDIEKIRDVHWPTVGKVFTQKQKKQLEDTPEIKKPQVFTRLWTKGEAVLKLRGTGFASDMESKCTGTLQADKECDGSEWPSSGSAVPIVRCIQYKEYIISCAANEEFYVSVEESNG